MKYGERPKSAKRSRNISYISGQVHRTMVSNKPPREMALARHPPVVQRLLDVPAAGLTNCCRAQHFGNLTTV